MSDFRVPPAADEIQVNFCRNPCCANFGVPAQITKLDLLWIVALSLAGLYLALASAIRIQVQ
jgi:hypothetical protein